MRTMRMRSRINILEFKGLKLSDLKNVKIDICKEDLPKFYNDTPDKWYSDQDLCTSDCKCWNCGMSFSGVSTFIPLNARRVPPIIDSDGNKTEEKLLFDRYGIYCSWPCAARDAHYRFGRQKNYSDIQQGLRIVYNIIHGSNVIYVRMAPDKTTMAEYCGNGGMSNNDYINAIKMISLKMREEFIHEK